MADHLFIVRIRSKGTAQPARDALRAAIGNGLDAWPIADLKMVSVSHVPRDRIVKRRKSPVRPQFPLVDLMEAPK